MIFLLFLAGLCANFWLAWDTLPYFPVEISHTLSATRANVVLNGIVVLSFPWLLEDVFPALGMRLWLMVAVLLLAYDDHRLNVHQLAIYHLLALFLGNMLYYCGWKITVLYILFYGSRGFSKVYLVSVLLTHKTWRDWTSAPTRTFLESYEYIKRPKDPGHIVLRMGAVWQWLVWAVAIAILEFKPLSL